MKEVFESLQVDFRKRYGMYEERIFGELVTMIGESGGEEYVEARGIQELHWYDLQEDKANVPDHMLRDIIPATLVTRVSTARALYMFLVVDAHLCVRTEAGAHQSTLRLAVGSDLRTDVVLGFDWFQHFALATHTWQGHYSSLKRLVDLYEVNYSGGPPMTVLWCRCCLAMV
ncbi:hypothetical protein F5146DRAFT_1006687 [Armillaria mellea]|nr:hypothetical protein F5146DRAFT_1006687 [Armillaria mellea]